MTKSQYGLLFNYVYHIQKITETLGYTYDQIHYVVVRG